MNANEGLRRVVRVSSALAWVALAGGVILAGFNGNDENLALAILIAAAVSFVVLQGLAWIIAGFSGNHKDHDGLIRLPRLRGQKSPKIGSDSGPTGIGGWLLFLIVILIFISPLRNIGETISAISDAEKTYPGLLYIRRWMNYKAVLWVIVGLAVLVSVGAGIRLRFLHKPQSVTLAIGALWFCGPISFCLVVIANFLLLDLPIADQFDASLTGTSIAIFIMAGVWTAYLKRSRRVRNTYFSQAQQEAPPSAPY